MAIRQDDRALLQLICERGQSYEDLAGLLGISEDEVRAKARAALTELGGSDPDAEVGLTDYLLGQADPIGRAEAVRFLQQDESARELALDVSTKLQAIAPGAEMPSIPDARGRKRKAPAPAPAPATGESTAEPAPHAEPGRPSGEAREGSRPDSRLIAGIAAAGVIVLFAVLALAGVFSSDDGGASSTTADSTTASDGTTDTTNVTLEPVGGSGVAGEVLFGLANETLFAELSLNGLDPDLGRDEVHLMWLMLPGDSGYPIPIPIEPNDNGVFNDRIAIPTAVAIQVAGVAEGVRISTSNVDALTKAAEKAADAESPVLAFEGKNLAEGEIPLADPEELGLDPEAGGQGGSGGGQGGGGQGNKGGGGNSGE